PYYLAFQTGLPFITADIPHRGPDFGEFLSVKPCIPLAQELEEGLVLVGQIQHHESSARDVKHMNPHEVVTHPACSWRLDTLALCIRPVPLALATGPRRVRSSRGCNNGAGRHAPDGPRSETPGLLRYGRRSGQAVRQDRDAPASYTGVWGRWCGRGETGAARR